jgi:DNA-binding NarL/FixJ family response regulator
LGHGRRRTPAPEQVAERRIFAIDARPLLRAGLAALARQALDCGSQALRDVDQAATAARLTKAAPSAVLLGLAPGDDPARLLAAARRLGAPVVCVLDPEDGALVRSALEAGADGYLVLGEIDAPALRQALAAVEAGEQRALPAALRAQAGALRASAVTARGLDVLRSLADGLHDGEIADELGISTSSVRKHIASAQDRLRASTRTQLIAIAARHGLV